MPEPRIALCVVTYNSGPLIEEFVAAVPEGTAGTDSSLVFADNGSQDDTLEQIARWAPEALVVRTGGNLGYAGGVNAAVRAAGDQDAYLILNADVRLGPGCVRTLFEGLGNGVGIVVPRLVDQHGELIWSMRREPSVLRTWADALVGAEHVGRIASLGEVVTDPAAYTTAQATDWAEGSTQLVGAECWRVCGEWDESLFLYSEETEYDLRARDNGLMTWYEPAAVATHLEGGSATSPRQWSLLVANRLRLFRMRHGPAATGLVWLALVVREGSRALLGKPTSRAAIRDLVNPIRMRQARGPEWLEGVRL
ncbi:glycosyltransferase family 2 protein [Leifsonia sp. P73]|uniref:glycosyltransferase family 2 protein n=1 Tax=Leifsonia sp. P73 TaxID=3423959 RepID=UPI003DA53D54